MPPTGVTDFVSLGNPQLAFLVAGSVRTSASCLISLHHWPGMSSGVGYGHCVRQFLLGKGRRERQQSVNDGRRENVL